MVLLLAPEVDCELLANDFPWLDMAYAIFDEMILQGYLQATARKTELQHLHQVVTQIPSSARPTVEATAPQGSGQQNPENVTHTTTMTDSLQMNAGHFDYNFLEDAMWRTAFTADQLMTVADTLDLDGIEWMTAGSSNLAE